MFFKKLLALALSLPFCAAAIAQSNDGAKPKAAATAPAAPASETKAVVSAPEVKSAAVTIADLAAKQANALAASANKEVSAPGPTMPSPIGQIQPKPVPELKPEQAIGLTTDRDVKPFQLAKPPPPKPYLAAVIGLKGKEIAEVQTSPNSSITVKAGDSIKGWSVEKIVGSQLYLAKSEVVTAKKKKKTTVTRQYIWMVGDFLN